MENTKTVSRKKLCSIRDESWFLVEAFYDDAAILNDGTLVPVLEVAP